MTILIGIVVLIAAELVVLVEVARLIGVVPAVLLLIGTGVFGPPLVRRVGFGVWRRAQARIDQGEVPGREIVDGVILLAGGILICIPGFITDVIGVLLFLPPVRAAARWLVTRRFLRRTRLVVGRVAGGSGDGRPIDVTTRDRRPPGGPSPIGPPRIGPAPDTPRPR